MIKTSTIGYSIGEGIIDTQGNQVATKTTASQRIASYVIVLKNTGNSVDYFSVTATGKKLGWHVRFADPTGKDITQMVNSGWGWAVLAVPAGQIVSFRLDVTPSSGIANNDVIDVVVTAASKVDATKVDQVKATTIKVK